MATLQTRPVATINAAYSGQSGSINIKGVTADTLTQEQAAACINVILGVVNKAVVSNGLTRTLVQDGGDSND